MSKVNKSWRIGPCTGEEMNHVWRLLRGAGEPTYSSSPHYHESQFNCLRFRESACGWVGVAASPEVCNISYKDFVTAMTSKVDDWQSTTWDARDWTEEQRIQFQEKCFELGYVWGMDETNIYHLEAKTYQLWTSCICFCDDMDWLEKAIKAGKFTPKKLEDMFPSTTSSNKPNSHHDCALHYSRILATCLKCHPEADPRNNKETWGILDTARREQEFIEEVRRGRNG